FTFTEEATLTYTGPGEVEFVENPNENKYTIRIETPGLYYFTAEVDHEGNNYTDSIAILVMDQGELDALLKAKWDAMKASLIESDIDGALSYFYETSKGGYQQIFNLLIDRLPAIASAMREIQPIYFKNGTAKYRIKREEVVQGQTYDITYYIYFIKNCKGLWKIESY
ncbi:MAG: adhesin, partial [Deltaproteobacteria bacterium]|nr:adhesin [Deltaproteobacteria bacterium]